MAKVCVIIPTLNEEGGIVRTLKTIPRRYDIFVIDSSTDDTPKIAKELGAKVIRCEKRGKGNAIKMAVSKLDYDVYVFMDGDGTYDGRYIQSLVKSLIEGGCGIVIGSRFLGTPCGMSLFRKFGNKILTKIFNLLNGCAMTDVSSGLRAVTKKFIKGVKLRQTGFGIETEMALLAVKGGYGIGEIPIRYQKRIGSSKLRLTEMVKILIYAIGESLK
jgi:glycosyltransferase involved in cell wall biosynthesis